MIIHEFTLDSLTFTFDPLTIHRVTSTTHRLPAPPPHARVQVSSVQFAVQQVQNVMRQWDGSFLQFRCDEKGFVAICAFGLPGHTHEDNTSRGILAALELVKNVKEGNHRVCVGVTTGDLLCTCVRAGGGGSGGV